jgi:hypothetical protein
MSRRVPEFALVTGVVLALAFSAFALAVTGDIPRSALTGAAFLYPFAAYAVVHSDDPTDVLPPDLVLGVAVAVAGFVAIATALAGVGDASDRLFFGLFVALVISLPAAAYHVRFGRRVNPLSPRRTVAATGGVALAILALGLATGSAVYGSVDALLVFLGGSLAGDARGAPPDRRTRRTFVAFGALLALALVGAGWVRALPLGDALVAGMAALLGPSLYVALTASGIGAAPRA